MKRLIVSALFVSVFFIGVSSLIDSVGAKFRSDEKAMEIIRASRVAIGGDENLAAVKSMSIRATTTRYVEKAGMQDVEAGRMEIDFELPGRFAKRVMIGDPGSGLTDADIEKEVQVEVVRGAGAADADGKGNVFVFRTDGDEDVEWTSDSDEKVKVSDGKVIISKGDGTVEEIDAGDNKRVIVRKMGDGETIDVQRIEGGDVNVFETGDGKRIVMKGGHGGVHKGANEMLQTTIALLMTAPNDGSVSFKFAGQGTVDGFPSNIIDVESKGSAFKLYIDASTYLPRMISHAAGHHRRMAHGKNHAETGERMMRMKKDPSKMHTREIRFSDFRNVGGLMLPHKWTESAGGKTRQLIDITSYEINPADIGERFGSEGAGGGAGMKVIKKRIEKN